MPRDSTRQATSCKAVNGLPYAFETNLPVLDGYVRLERVIHRAPALRLTGYQEGAQVLVVLGQERELGHQSGAVLAVRCLPFFVAA
jgi:hypothetical protein